MATSRAKKPTLPATMPPSWAFEGRKELLAVVVTEITIVLVMSSVEVE